MTALSTIIANYKRRSIDVARRSCDELSNRTVRRTPVDTGVLRRSWTPSLNRFDDSNTGGLSTSVTNRMEVGDRYTFVNGQDYVRPIEYLAHSPQAPGGMMRVSIAEFAAIVAEQAQRARRGS